jgi:hypothetical protein
MTRFVALAGRLLVALGALAGALPAAAASAAVDQAMRLGDSDPITALVILEKADAAGDLEASAVLASTLFFAGPPRQNRARACTIAQRLIEARQGPGWSLMASCFLTGTVASAGDRLDAARAAARQAIALGTASGGTALFTAFSVDPRFGLAGADGQPDPAKRAALAAQPAAERKLQSEAWTGLSIALEQGDPMATAFGIAALADTSAPGNLERLLALAARSPANSQRFEAQVKSAQRFKSLGGTHASLRSASDARRAALTAARVAAVRDGIVACEALELARIEPGAGPQDASYLPVAIGPLKNAYLVSGQWEERWVFSACEREVAVQVVFTADGWGGARFEASPAPRSVVRRAP